MGTVPKRRAVIYCRISQDREGAGLGVERQLNDCTALARKLGWQIVAEHTDNDLSAYSGKPRPGYRALLADVDAGRADAVIVWHTDRLHRSPRELEEYIDVCERRKVTTQTVKAGELDLATPSGRAVARTLGAWARFEGEHKSERTRRAQLQAAQAGKWLGGAPPLGWTLRPGGAAVLDRPAARRIAKASSDVLAGVSLGSIVTAWNSADFTTSTGKPWNYTSLRQVLTRARNAGLVEYNGEIVAQSTWPPIVSEDTWRALVGLFAEPGRRRSQSNRARWLLAGIATCGREGCGAPMRSATAGRPNGGKVIVYRCPAAGTGHVTRMAEPMDDLIDRVMRARLARRDVLDLLVDTSDPVTGDDPQGEAIALRKRLDEIADAYAAGTVTLAQLQRITDGIRGQLDDLATVAAARARGSVLSGIANASDPVKAWTSAATERRRSVVRELLEVTVLPIPAGKWARVFDPELIRIEWRS